MQDFAMTFNERKQTDIMYMDFRKTFDNVLHNKLFYKLSQVIGWKIISMDSIVPLYSLSVCSTT